MRRRTPPSLRSRAACATDTTDWSPEFAAIKLAAISVGCVVMGATTYVGNGPNLIVKAMAERAGHAVPSFFRYALFAFFAMLPAQLVMTAVFVFLD
jgi:Na+/H+ antiporter NhaD/arsenite permease-like protein